MNAVIKHLPFWVLAFFAAVLFAVNLFFDQVHLYFFVWWLDIPMHFLSGFLIGLVSLAIVSQKTAFFRTHRSNASVFAVTIIFTLAVGVCWEIYGYKIGHFAPFYGGVAIDTAKDLVSDVLGGIAASFFFLGKGYNRNV